MLRSFIRSNNTSLQEEGSKDDDRDSWLDVNIFQIPTPRHNKHNSYKGSNSGDQDDYGEGDDNDNTNDDNNDNSEGKDLNYFSEGGKDAKNDGDDGFNSGDQDREEDDDDNTNNDNNDNSEGKDLNDFSEGGKDAKNDGDDGFNSGDQDREEDDDDNTNDDNNDNSEGKDLNDFSEGGKEQSASNGDDADNNSFDDMEIHDDDKEGDNVIMNGYDDDDDDNNINNNMHGEINDYFGGSVVKDDEVLSFGGGDDDDLYEKLRYILYHDPSYCEFMVANWTGGSSTSSYSPLHQGKMLLEGSTSNNSPSFIECDYTKCSLIGKKKNGILKCKGPLNEEWLSNVNIDCCLHEFSLLFNDFYPINFTMSDWENAPYDHDLKRLVGSASICQFISKCEKDFLGGYEKGKSTMGFVINTDTWDGSGQHWVSAFIDMRDPKNWSVEFFNSSGGSPLKEIDVLLNRVVKKMENCKSQDCKVYRKLICDLRHQKGDNQCGSYALYYILQRLKGVEAEYFNKNIITDDEMKEFRSYLFQS